MDSNNNKSDYFCKLFDKPIKIKSKNKHLKSLNHQSLTKTIISRYYVSNPNFFQIEYVLKKYVDDYNKKFVFI